MGYYENFISAIKKTRGEYLLTLVDHDVPQKGFYLQLLAKFKNKNYKNLIFLPFEKVKPYKKKIFGLNKLGYVVERGFKPRQLWRQQRPFHLQPSSIV